MLGEDWHAYAQQKHVRLNDVKKNTYFISVTKKAMEQELLFLKKLGTRLTLFSCYYRLK